MTERYDIAVIGSGPGGYVAAIRAAKRGAGTVLIEDDVLGGVCLNYGCIPSKNLITASSRFVSLKNSSKWGCFSADPTFDWKKIISHKNQVVKRLVKGIDYLIRKNGIDFIRGHARLRSGNQIKIEMQDGDRNIHAGKIILALGSKPAVISSFNIDREKIVTSREALDWESLPEKLLIVGGGIIGCEFATMFHGFGVDVTLVEATENILSLTTLDSDIIQKLKPLMKRSGIKIKTGIKLEKITRTNHGIRAELADGNEINSDKAIVCIGRIPNTGNTDLEKAGVETDEKGYVHVTDHMQTQVENIYAIGDMNGRWQLAHTASFQGIIAADHATGNVTDSDSGKEVPYGIFTIPPAASVGLSEEKAEKKGYDVMTSTYTWKALPKAVTSDATEGLLKIIADKKSDMILGAHILGEGSPELIHEFTAAIQNKITARDLMRVIHAHPTYSEAVQEACGGLYDLDIHSA